MTTIILNPTLARLAKELAEANDKGVDKRIDQIEYLLLTGDITWLRELRDLFEEEVDDSMLRTHDHWLGRAIATLQKKSAKFDVIIDAVGTEVTARGDQLLNSNFELEADESVNTEKTVNAEEVK